MSYLNFLKEQCYNILSNFPIAFIERYLKMIISLGRMTLIFF